MEPAADEGLGGSFDDVADAALRTVLAIPLEVPPLPAPADQEQAETPSPPRPGRRARPSAHRAGRGHQGLRSELAATLRVGLSAALTVFLAVALAMLAVQAFVR